MVNKFRFIFFILSFYLPLVSSEIANYGNPTDNRNMVFFLSTPKSGSNLITGCLSAITRKPISWLSWGGSILEPSSENRKHPSYNRLSLPLISDIPLLYRTHYDFATLVQIPSEQNKLIFVTRNPKELIYRSFLLQTTTLQDPDSSFIKEFLDDYLMAFNVYESWSSETKKLIFYEDFIRQDTALLLQLIEFMDERPTYLEDFLHHKEEYLTRLLTSYTNQHKHNNGGSSSKRKPSSIYYTRNASKNVLVSIDEYLINNAPEIWVKYLQRFKERD